SSCGFDYVAIHDGSHESSPLLGKFCGVARPSPITSTTNVIYVRFRSDHSQNHKGFSAQFSEACGSTITADDVGGEIASPRYPYSYPPNQNCSWIIRAQEPCKSAGHTWHPLSQVQNQGFLQNYLLVLPLMYLNRFSDLYCPIFLSVNHVTLSFTDFEVEMVYNPLGYITSPNYPSNYPQNINCVWIITVPNGEAVQLDFEGNFYIEAHTGCMYDYIKVRDGPTSDAALMGRLCGNTHPSTQHSSGTTMYIRFRTDGILHCGIIRSPGYPDSNYPDNSNCEWYLEGPTGNYLTLTYTTLDLQSSSNFFLIVEDSKLSFTFSSGRLLGKHCGNSLPAPLDTGDSFAYVKFVSDGSWNAAGFSLSFEASVEGKCV
uniref:CUB domain-containing protein n=1 Tax=Sinocyclocheilus grahami TaxID=75366 RepID=A0A672RJ07_SINGR